MQPSKLPTGPKRTAINYGRILNSQNIPEEHKIPICRTLQAEMLTEDQLLQLDEPFVKKLFPQTGIQLTVLRWRREFAEESRRQDEVRAKERTIQPSMETALNNRHKIHAAAKNGDLPAIKALLQEVRSKLPVSISPDEVRSILRLLIEHKNRRNYNRTPLLEAAQQGNLSVVKYLIEDEQADLNEQDDYGNYVIHPASQAGSVELITFLLQRRPDFVEARNNFGRTPLHQAAGGGQLRNVRYFVEKAKCRIDDADTDTHALAIHLAAKYGSADVIAYLLHHRPEAIDARDKLGRTPFLYSAEGGKLENVRYLLEEANANIDDKDTETEALAIHLAAHVGSVEVIEYFLQTRPDFIEARDMLGRTPLHQAATGGSLENVRFLVEQANANIDAVDTDTESSAVHLAAHFGYVKVIAYLLQLRPKAIEVKNNLGRTPLLDAAIGGVLENVRFLVEEADANINAKDSVSQSLAIHLAAHFGSVGVIVYLLQQKPVFLEAKNKLGRTPFLEAAVGGKLENVRFFVEKAYADLDAIENTTGDTALHLAARYGHHDVLHYLGQRRPDLMRSENDDGKIPMECRRIEDTL